MYSSESPTTILDSARQVADLGLRVHPLIDKRPLLEDWPHQATNNLKTIQSWFSTNDHNYGILCDEVAVIDTDTAELSDWWQHNMPQTPWRVRTPGGGMHFFYRSVPNLKNAVKAHRGWDVRAGGNGYVVGFGSVVNGKKYELVGKITLDLPPFEPAWLPREKPELQFVPSCRHPAQSRRRIRNLRAYIRRIFSIQGQRGSDACFRVACILRDEGKSPHEALEMMIEWNEHCAVPTWSVEELAKKVRDAFAKTRRGG